MLSDVGPPPTTPPPLVGFLDPKIGRSGGGGAIVAEVCGMGECGGDATSPFSEPEVMGEEEEEDS